MIAAQSSETFVIIVGASAIVGLFASEAGRLVTLEGEPLYPLDWLEIAPERRGQGLWGPLAVAAAAARAEECGAVGLALPALPYLEDWYKKAVGAVRLPKRAWKVKRDLVPMKVVGRAFSDLVEAIDGS